MKLNLSLMQAGIAILFLLSGFAGYSVYLIKTGEKKEELACDKANLSAENKQLKASIAAILAAQEATNRNLMEIQNDLASPDETIPASVLRTLDGMYARRQLHGNTNTASGTVQ